LLLGGQASRRRSPPDHRARRREVLASDADGRCQLDDGPALAAETARRLGCDAVVVTITEDDHGTPLDVGRKTRTISPALRRALAARDQGCRFPGCTNTRFVDGHHIKHWAHGGETSLWNLVSVCDAHHRALHEGGYRAEATGDPAHPVAFFRPDGTRLPSQPPPLPPGDLAAIVEANRRLGLDIGPTTGHPSWAGEHLDQGLALDALFPRRAPRTAGVTSVADG
jgi:hypothetical protein